MFILGAKLGTRGNNNMNVNKKKIGNTRGLAMGNIVSF